MNESMFLLINPSHPLCPFINPLLFPEKFIAFLTSDNGDDWINENVLNCAIKILTRLDKASNTEGAYLTPLNLSRLLQNLGGKGREMIQSFTRIAAPTEEEARENADIASFFLNEYLSERSKIHSAMLPCISKLNCLNSGTWGKIINPDYAKGEKSYITPAIDIEVYISISWLNSYKNRLDDEFTKFLITCLKKN